MIVYSVLTLILISCLTFFDFIVLIILKALTLVIVTTL